MQASSLHEIARLTGAPVSRVEAILRDMQCEPLITLDGLRYWDDRAIPAVKAKVEGRPDHPVTPHLADLPKIEG